MSKSTTSSLQQASSPQQVAAARSTTGAAFLRGLPPQQEMSLVELMERSLCHPDSSIIGIASQPAVWQRPSGAPISRQLSSAQLYDVIQDALNIIDDEQNEQCWQVM